CTRRPAYYSNYGYVMDYW
nr:immunoglobulin heavy chain junction region [Mus musculus]